MSLVAAAAALLAACGGSSSPPPDPTYQVELRYDPTVLPSWQPAFEGAAARMNEIVTAGPAPLTVQHHGKPVDCASQTRVFPVQETVHGLLVLVSVEDLRDLGTLAVSGPCIVRSSNGLPAVATMTFNSQRIASLEQDGRLEEVVLHELFHTLGFGTIWDEKGKLSGTGDPGFTGGEALSAAKEWNGAPESWHSLPVESIGGTGTAGSHWSESVFGNELMTGFVDADPNPLSEASIASLEDLGYRADLTLASAFTIPNPGGLRALKSASPGIPVGDDVLRLTPIAVDDDPVP